MSDRYVINDLLVHTKHTVADTILNAVPDMQAMCSTAEDNGVNASLV